MKFVNEIRFHLLSQAISISHVYDLYALLEIHHISFVILKDIRDNGSHYLAVALAVDCSQVDQLGHIEDPVVIDYLVVKLQ